jgi:flagellar biogenesis protein FliO
VAILEVEGRRFLLGATQQAVTLLAELRPCARVLETPGTATIGEITVPDGEKATRHGAGRDPDDRETDGHDTDDREHAA